MIEHITYQITEFIQTFGEGEQNDSKISDESQQTKEESEWIDIKGNTYKKTNEQIKKIINVFLFDENAGNEESKEFENQFKELSINPKVNSSKKNSNDFSFEDLFGSLMKRP